MGQTTAVPEIDPDRLIPLRVVRHQASNGAGQSWYGLSPTDELIEYDIGGLQSSGDYVIKNAYDDILLDFTGGIVSFLGLPIFDLDASPITLTGNRKPAEHIAPTYRPDWSFMNPNGGMFSILAPGDPSQEPDNGWVNPADSCPWYSGFVAMASPWGSGSPDPGNHPTNPCTPGQWAYIYGADDEWTGGSAEMVMLEGDVENTELSPSAPWSTCWHWTGREFDDGYTQGYLAYAADWTTDVPNPDIMGIIYNIPGDDL